MNPIQGKNATLSVRGPGDEYYPLICASDFSYQCDVELIEKTGPNSGFSRERIRRLEDHHSTLTGISPIVSDEVITIFDIYDQRRTEQSFQATFEDDDGNLRQFTGPGVFGTMSLVVSASDLVHTPVEIWWNGAPVVTKVGTDSLESG